jgi:hypothetical protein
MKRRLEHGKNRAGNLAGTRSYQIAHHLESPDKMTFPRFTNCTRSPGVENIPPSARITTVGKNGSIAGANRFI